jgi:phosphatidylglycerol lysyltransferase
MLPWPNYGVPWGSPCFRFLKKNKRLMTLKKKSLTLILITVITLGGGLLNLFSLIMPAMPARIEILVNIFPLYFIHLSRYITLMLGFLLVVSSVNIYKRKKRAWQIVLVVTFLSMIFHLLKGLDYWEALASLMLVILLVFNRKLFSVKSSIPSLAWGIVRFLTIYLVAILYGVAGFWFLDEKHFLINFHLNDSFRETFLYLALIGDGRLIAYTRFAGWFLDSLYIFSAMSLIYAIFAVFRPVIYRFHTYPRQQQQVKNLVEQYGRCALDYFKFWPDKSFYFNETLTAVIAYRVANSCAIVLGDPVGPEGEIEVILNGFSEFCAENDWDTGIYQTLPDFKDIYEKSGFKKLKVGDDAITDLTKLSLEGHQSKEYRHALRKIEAKGIVFRIYEPPVPDAVLAQIQRVSAEWLKMPGHRERQFTVGKFELNYVRSTTIFTAETSEGRILAFLNQIPSYLAGEATIDLMRRVDDAPNAIMDYLFIRLFFYLKEKGFQRFNLGLAPSAGPEEDEDASFEEKAVRFFLQHLNFLFNFEGLYKYKAKFASHWEPRYLHYKNAIELVKITLALRNVSEIGRTV